MTDPSDRPQDEPRDGTGQEPPREDGDGSTLAGFSWDDPSGGAAPVRPDDEARSGSSAAGHDGQTPAQYPPAAPYPPAGSAPSERPLDERAAAFGEQPGPYSQGSGYGQGSGQQSWQGSGQGSGYGEQPPAQPWSEQPAPPPGQPPYGQAYPQQPYGAPYGRPPEGSGYGQSSPYTSTPQPYSYGAGGALTPEAEKARSNAILWTILNGVAIFLCGNLLAIPGVVLAAFGISKASTDVSSSRNLTRWSWILFAAGFALWVLLIIGFIALGFAGTLAGTGGFDSM